jgi:hypothetical protein
LGEDSPKTVRGKQFSKLFAAFFIFALFFIRHGFENRKEKPCFGIAAYPFSSAACPQRAFPAAAPRLPRSILKPKPCGLGAIQTKIERRKGT